MSKLDSLLAYVQAAKKAAAVNAHQGREDYRYWEGVMVAYQDIENLMTRGETPEQEVLRTWSI